MAIGLMAASGCATAAPSVVSQRQIDAFEGVVAEAEAEGGRFAENGSELEVTLREAKSDFYYAEHSPMHPARARAFAQKAQREAEVALALAREKKAAHAHLQLANGAGPDEPAVTAAP